MNQNPIQRGIQSVSAETNIPHVLEDLQKAFADFKAENNRQLQDLQAGIGPDPLQLAKIENINAEVGKLQAEIDGVNLKLASVQMNSGQPQLRDSGYSAAFLSHMQKGEVNAELHKGVDKEGGYLTPVEWDRTITDKLIQISPIRQLASVQTISNNGYIKLLNDRGATSGWVGEKDDRPETDTPGFSALRFETGEIYANPAATQQVLDDAEINLEAWLAGEVQTEFAYQEGVAFLSGNGVNKPDGLLTYATGGSNANKHPWGPIESLSSGAANDISSDGIIDLIYGLPSEYTGNASFLMNRNTQGRVRKLRDGQGNYLWQPSFQVGQPATLGSYPLHEVVGMPDVAANSLAMAFGDIRRSYLVIDRMGVRVLRDPYTKKPYVQFYTTKRVGGGVSDPTSMKFMHVGD